MLQLAAGRMPVLEKISWDIFVRWKISESHRVPPILAKPPRLRDIYIETLDSFRKLAADWQPS
jgi:hypothetical protein